MTDSTPVRRNWLKRLSEPSATVVASTIGGLCAVAAAVLPGLLRSPAPPAAEPATAASVGAAVQTGASTPAPTAAAISAEAASPVTGAASPVTGSVSPVTGSAVFTATPASELPPALTASQKPQLTYGAWTLMEGRDEQGDSFVNSTIKFTSQQETADGLEFAGFFEWRQDGTLSGREFFTGRYVDPDRLLFFEGHNVQGPPGSQLAIGSYSARLSDDGRRLTDGTWGSTPGNLDGVAGRWAARR